MLRWSVLLFFRSILTFSGSLVRFNGFNRYWIDKLSKIFFPFFDFQLPSNTCVSSKSSAQMSCFIFVSKPTLWSGPYKMPTSVLLIIKTWNLVSVSIWITWHHPINLVKSRDLLLILWTVLYFTDHLFQHFTDCSVT